MTLESPTLSFEEWDSGLQEKYHKLKTTIESKMPDVWEPLEFTLSVLMILSIKDNTLPFAGIILGNASSFKTVGIEMLRTWSATYYSDSFTPKSFVSHNTSVKREQLAKIDMLPKIKHKLLLAPELAPIFTKREEDLTDMIGILTRVLDGHGLETDSGAHGQRGYSGDYMFTMIGASVDIPYRVHKVLGNLGPKLYFLRLSDKGKKEDGEYICQLNNNSFNEDFREIQRLLVDYLHWFERCPTAEKDLDKMLYKIEWNSDKNKAEALKTIIKLGKLLSHLRGVIPTWETRDSQGIDYAYTIASKENPDRAIYQLYNLARGHALLEGRNYVTMKDIPLLIQVTLSTASRERVKIFEALIDSIGVLTTSEIKKEVNTSNNTAKRTMQEFVALGLVTLIELGNNGPTEYQIQLNSDFEWFLSPEFQKLRERYRLRNNEYSTFTQFYLL